MESIMHQYLVFIEVPSTAPMFGEMGLNTDHKLRVVGTVKADNSAYACGRVAKAKGLDIDKLKAVVYNDGLEMFKS